MQRFILIAVFIITTPMLFSQNSDFRNTKWGMSPEEVKNKEIATISSMPDDPKNLVYKSDLIGYDVWIVYHFIENKLVRAGYTLILENPSTLTECSKIFEELKENLVKRYGKTIFDENSENDSPEKKEFYLELNLVGWGLQNYCTWETQRTKIGLKLTYTKERDNPPFGIIIKYLSKIHESLLQTEDFSEF